MKKPLRVATIRHNWDTYHCRPEHLSVRLELHKDGPKQYIWRTDEGEDCLLGVYPSIRYAEEAALRAWGTGEFNFKAAWAY